VGVGVEVDELRLFHARIIAHEVIHRTRDTARFAARRLDFSYFS
jgi:hypothetical protein